MDVAPWAGHWFKMVLDGSIWYCMVFDGIQWYLMVLDGIGLGVEQNFVLWQELPEFSGFNILIAMVPFARSNLWIK